MAPRRTPRDAVTYEIEGSEGFQFEPRTTIPSRDVSPLPRNPDFPKSASYTYLPHAKDSAYSSAASLPITIKGSVSEDDLTAPLDSADVSPPDSSGYNTPNEDHINSSDISRDSCTDFEKSPQITIIKASEETDRGSIRAEPSSETKDGAAIIKTVKPSKSLAKRLSRKLIQTPSRSPSPTKQPTPSLHTSDDAQSSDQALAVAVEARKKSLLKKRENQPLPPDDTESVRPSSRTGSILKRRSTLSSKKSSSDKSLRIIPGIPSLPKSFSTDRLPIVSETHASEHSTPVPRISPSDRVTNFGALSLPRKKDELWTIFRSLDADYAKFAAKSTALKTNVVRQSLIPFLRNYASHPSIRNLRPEDLDRRTNIFNKWWTGLLELLHGKNNQSLSGTDRPAILDALSGLMDRPEWRLYPSILAPLSDRAKDSAMSRNKSSISLASLGGDFLAESVHHNVRNLFVQNLNAQMAFVVEKMSLRSASASLITFCGKATAFAFYFCPGIADILVRLWATPVDTMRRVLSENGIGKFENLKEITAEIAPPFPPNVRSLAFSSMPSMTRTLREQPLLPMGTANMQWYGYWMERWMGRESDLFYVFVKHFHVLLTDYLPSDATKKERICAPGVLLVHAQILTNLDSTIHRDAASHAEGSALISPSFDDLFGETDAVVSPVPLLPNNATRIMAENRLIMLIRDFLSERTSDHPVARHLFALSFNDLLHAAARKTSVFDHGACYTLCDFLEEALLILVRYEHINSSLGKVVDSAFWLDVYKRMLTSHNTLTEIRLFAFLYTTWSIVCSEQTRKEGLCLDLLLEDEMFKRTFNHWCPMVRAYYMRLLCWRVGRYDGEATEVDTRIYERLFELLRTEWSLFLFQREKTERARGPPLCTAPANPAPGRRLLIIRTDTQLAPGGSFLAFNGIITPSPSESIETPMMNSRRLSTMSQISWAESRPVSRDAPEHHELDIERESGLRSFLRGIMGPSRKRAESRDSQPSSRKGSPSPTPSPPNGLVRAATDGSLTPRARQSSAQKAPVQPPPPQHRNFCFKFSLEFNHKLASTSPVNMRLYPPRLPQAAQQYLHSREPGIPAVRAAEPKGEDKTRVKYVGRALAEWTLVVTESQGFFERRKGEGVPGDRFVETPTLGVETFRRSA